MTEDEIQAARNFAGGLVAIASHLDAGQLMQQPALDDLRTLMLEENLNVLMTGAARVSDVALKRLANVKKVPLDVAAADIVAKRLGAISVADVPELGPQCYLDGGVAGRLMAEAMMTKSRLSFDEAFGDLSRAAKALFTLALGIVAALADHYRITPKKAAETLALEIAQIQPR